MSKSKLIEEFTFKVIEFVKENEILYSSPESERKVCKSQTAMAKRRQCLWERFASDNNTDVEDCKKRWKYLRDAYVKHRKRNIRGIFSFKYAPMLSFLEKALDKKRFTAPLMQDKYDKQTNPEAKNKKEKPKEAQLEFETIDFPETNLTDSRVVTHDMLLKVLEIKKEEQMSTMFQMDKENDEIPAEINLNSLIAVEANTDENVIAFKVSNFMYKFLETENFSSHSTPDSVSPVVTPSTTPPIVTVKNETDNLIECTNTTFSGTNYKVESYHISNAIETQFKETETILKIKTDGGLTDFLDETSTAKFFEEMGEYVENRFPEQRQMDLKNKILALLKAVDR